MKVFTDIPYPTFSKPIYQYPNPRHPLVYDPETKNYHIIESFNNNKNTIILIIIFIILTFIVFSQMKE